MKRIDGDNVKGSPPPKTAPVSPGHFGEGSATEGATQVTDEWAEGVQEELMGVIEDVGGLSPDYDDNKQLASVVAPVRAFKTGGSGTVQGPTLDDRMVAVSSAGEVQQPRTCIIGGEAGAVPAGGGVPRASEAGGFLAAVKGGWAAGQRSAVIASQDCVAGDSTDPESAAIASYQTFINGTRSLGAASYDSVLPSGVFHSALLAAYQSSLSGTCTGAVAMAAQDSELASSDMSAILATRRGKALNSQRAAIIASLADVANTNLLVAGDQAAIIACHAADDPEHIVAGGDRSLIAACRNNVKTTGPGNAILASDGAGGGTNAQGEECFIGAADGACQAIASARHSCLLGVTGSQVQGSHGVIAGGSSNTISADRAFIGGGNANDADGVESGLVGCRDCQTLNANSGALASEDAELSAQNAAAMACGSGTQDTLIDAPQSYALGSRESIIKTGLQIGLASSRFVELISSQVFGGGYAVSAPANFGDGLTNKNVTAVLDFAGNYPGTTGPGQLVADQGTIASPADYAELFPNAEGRPLHPAMLLGRVGKAAKLAVKGDRVLGVVSANPAVLANGAPNSWHGKHQRDRYGRLIWGQEPWVAWPELYEERVTWPDRWERYRAKPKKDGSRSLLRKMVREGWEGPVAQCPIPREDWPDDAAVNRDQVRPGYHGPVADLPEGLEPPPDARTWDQRVPLLSEDYDEAKPYTPRALRPEAYVPVGLLGQVPLLCEPGVQVDDYLEPGDTPGIAAKAQGETRIEVMDVLEEGVEGLEPTLALVLIR